MAQDSHAPAQAAASSDPMAHEPRLIRLARFDDDRGTLVSGELADQLPFTPVRVFAIRDVPGGERRADHANQVCAEVLLCLRGRCSIEIHDGSAPLRFELTEPDVGVYVPPMRWLICEEFSPDCILLVLASHPYDPAMQVRDWTRFLHLLEDADRT